MPRGLSEIRADEVEADLEEVIYPQLAATIAARDAGHCMRVNDLDRLLARLPQAIRPAVADLLSYLHKECHWPWADKLAQARYLRTVLKNEGDPQAAGAALFELGLLPDLELLSEPPAALGRVQR